ncbi:MAG: hypothetical protein C0617_01080 [Desulfuromonas sp.]|uniref:tetratricopeptide repeat protein n=1 Tax=Desulfuromonas sp. TaxID=892 RepID=UPI000CCA67DE|nr:tetratricopeptide repeat protein [Desulfuromonas sp.]PLX86534.1 MAG: hypothetical protein C0617_01080 [Desulfuromonas sp.]
MKLLCALMAAWLTVTMTPYCVPALAEETTEAEFLEKLPSDLADAVLATRLEVGGQIPDFSLSPGMDKKPVTRESLRGKPAVLAFFALDNEIRQNRAIEMVSALGSLRRQSGETVNIFAICSDPKGCDPAVLKKASDGPIPVLDDAERTSYTLFGIFMMPTALVISAEGELVAKLPFAADLEETLKGWLRVARGEITAAELQALSQVDRGPEKTAEERQALHHLGLAKVMLKRRMYPQAVQEFAAAAKLTPADPSPLVQGGFALIKMQDWKNAETKFNQALDMDPDSLEAVAGLGLALHRQGRDEEALPELEDAAATVKPLPEVLVALAEIYTASGKKDLALQNYAKAAKKLLSDLERCESNLIDAPPPAQ